MCFDKRNEQITSQHSVQGIKYKMTAQSPSEHYLHPHILIFSSCQIFFEAVPHYLYEDS